MEPDFAGTVPTFRYPRDNAIQRHIRPGVPRSNIFRTNHHPTGSAEWPHPPDCGTTPLNEDHVLVDLPESGKPKVAYHATRCPPN